MMSSRKRILETLYLRLPDRVPVEMWFSPEVWAEYTALFNTQNLNDYFGLDIRRIFFQPQVSGGIEYQYPFPDKDFAYCEKSKLRDKVLSIQEKGFAVIGHAGSLCSEIAASLMGGMEKYLTALALKESSLSRLLDRIIGVKLVMMQEYARAGVDVIHIGDDFGSQHGLIMSPAMWREWFKSRIQKAINDVRQIKPDVAIIFHSDGNIEDIIPDFIEIGVNAINPVQPECMDKNRLKEKYQGKIAFWGGVGTQSTLPFGKPEDVEIEVRELIRTLGSNGGLVVCSSHMVPPGTPPENVLAFFEAANKFGAY